MRIAMFMPSLGPAALGWQVHLDFADAVRSAGHGEAGRRPLRVRLAVLKRRGGAVTPLAASHQLASSDRYGLFLRHADTAWVYVLQQDSSGKLDALFPNPAFSPRDQSRGSRQGGLAAA